RTACTAQTRHTDHGCRTAYAHSSDVSVSGVGISSTSAPKRRHDRRARPSHQAREVAAVHFAHLARRKDLTGRSTSIPRGFGPVFDALRAGRDVGVAVVEAGRDLAGDGVPLDEVVADLESAYAAAGVGEPDYRVVRDLCLAWTEVSLRYLHGLSCDDPLTGLASLAHLRSRLGEIYREAEVRGTRVADERARVVVEADQVARRADAVADGRSASVTRRFGSALRMADAADGLRSVFSGGETLARV